MKVLHINICGNLSTGNIASDLIRKVKEQGGDGILCYARNEAKSDVRSYRIGNQADVYVHAALSRITDHTAFYSKKATEELIRKIEEENPDIIHLHNLHGYYLHVGVLFAYLKSCGKQIVWTLHDCWPFTGHCCYFTAAQCDKWIDGCYNCPEKKSYPSSILMDRSKKNYLEKKQLFTDIPNLTLVTPSNWLKDMVKDSYLKDYSCNVIYNGIDQSLFYPREGDSFKKEHHLEKQKLLLGVASTWSERKGYADFCKLSELLPQIWTIVLVGLKEEQIQQLPANILGLGRTKDVNELAQIYSESDLYFNASVEETMGLTTVEAIFCGTPAIVYDATAVPECVEPHGENQNGYIVKVKSVDRVAEVIHRLESEELPSLKKRSVLYQNPEFVKEESCNRYYELYEKLMGRKTE